MKFKLFILPVSLLIALLAFIYFIKPEWESYRKNKSNLASKENDLEDLRKNQDKFLQALKSYNSINEYDQFLIKRAIPETILEEDFLYNLDLILKDTGVVLKEAKFDQIETRINHNNPDENLDLKKTEVSLSLFGNYFQIKEILYLIENFDRLVRINKMIIKENQQYENLDFELELVILNRDNYPRLEVDLKDSYLSSILKNGLDIDLVKDYKEYRGEVSNFDFIGDNVFNKEDLFDFGSKEDVLNSEDKAIAEGI